MDYENQKEVVIKLSRNSGIENTENLQAYVVDKSGKIIETAPFNGDQAILTTPKDSLDGNSKVYIARALPEDIKESKKNERTLQKLNAYETVKSFNGNVIVVNRLPSGILHPFPFYNCRITGHVNKNFTIDGQLQNLPLCDMRVHICEVETELIWPHLPIYYQRIPDWVIREIGEKFTNFVPKPVTPNPVTPNPVGPISFERNKVTKMDVPLRSLTTTQFSNAAKVNTTTALPENVLSNMKSGSIELIRKTMVDYHDLLYPYFCLWPIYWPWIYVCDEETIVTTDCNGHFEMWENTYTEDGPLNIYIWVEAFINGHWVTVYRPPIPCHTWWNYSCNTNINITVTDPRVLPCICGQHLHGEIVWYRSVGESATALHIEQGDSHTVNVQGISFPNVGCTDVTDANRISPFGSSLSFKLLFGDGLPTAGITHYRWRKTRIKNEVLTNVVSPSTSVVDGSVQKYYFVITTDGSGHMHFETKSVTLGAEGSGQNIGYRIPHWDIYQDPGVPAADKLLTIQWTSPDFWSASVDSNSLSDGLWRFDLELLHLDGANVFQVVQVPKQVFQVSDYANSGNSIDAPDNYLMIANQYLNTIPPNPNADNLAVKIRIDNVPCHADIQDASITVNGSTEYSGRCGFLHYTDVNQSVHISFIASQPRNFASFSFSVVKGNGTENPGVSQSGYVISSIGLYTLSGGIFYDDALVSQLLGTCPQAAFAENLYVSSLATDGTRRLIEYDDSDTNAFALSNT